MGQSKVYVRQKLRFFTFKTTVFLLLLNIYWFITSSHVVDLQLTLIFIINESDKYFIDKCYKMLK